MHHHRGKSANPRGVDRLIRRQEDSVECAREHLPARAQGPPGTYLDPGRHSGARAGGQDNGCSFRTIPRRTAVELGTKPAAGRTGTRLTAGGVAVRRVAAPTTTLVSGSRSFGSETTGEEVPGTAGSPRAHVRSSGPGPAPDRRACRRTVAVREAVSCGLGCRAR